MSYQELKQMAPEEINKLAESIDKVKSFYGEMDIGEKWDNWRNTYGGSPLATFEKDGVTYVLTDDKEVSDGQFTNTVLDIGIFTNPITTFFLGLIGAFEDPIPKGISTPYIVRVPYKEKDIGEEVEEVLIEEKKEKVYVVPETEEKIEVKELDSVSRQKKPKDNFYENLIESNEEVRRLHESLNKVMKGYNSNKN